MYVRREADGRTTLPLMTDVRQFLPSTAVIRTVYTNIGTLYTCGMQTLSDATKLEARDFRTLYETMDRAIFKAAGKAKQIVFWDAHSRYCPQCGVETFLLTEIAKKCPQCGYEIYPPISPAVIVRIRRGDEILLVHALNFRKDFYGLVAGFLEAGETLEECVCREVREETGLEIENLKYFGSQSWPYPSGVMIGYTADYKSGEIKIQETELSDAQFFSRDNLPTLPDKLSIARRLIDDWLGEK